MNERLKILFVCAMNVKRSATAEQMYRDDARIDVRSAGTRTGAKRRVSEGDLRWANAVFVMERDQKQWIQERFQGTELPRIDVLDVPDDFEFMDTALQELLRPMLDAEIEALLSERVKRMD